MQNLQHILALSDFSPSSNSAIVYALNLAEQIHARLHILHVTNDEDTDATEQIEQLRHDFLSRSRVEVDIHVEHGPIKETIDEVIKRERVDLIVIGMQGASSREDGSYGKLTSAMITEPCCSILSIPDGCKTLDIKHMAVMTDLRSSVHYSEAYALSFIAEVLKPQVHVLHIKDHSPNPHRSDYEQRVKKLFPYNHMHWTEEQMNGEFNATVQGFIEEHHIDLITVFHKLKLHKNPTHRSVSKQMAFQCKIPLLTVPISE